MNQLIRHRQRTISAVRKPRQLLVPNRRAKTPVAFTASLGGGAFDEGNGQYKLLGPSAELDIKVDAAALADLNEIGGILVLYYDVIEVSVGGVITNQPDGTYPFVSDLEVCADPIPAGFHRMYGGMIPSQNQNYYAIQRNQPVPVNGIPADAIVFTLKTCSNVPAADYEIVGNFKLERYLG